MKNLSSLLLLMTFLLSGCFTQKDYIAEYDFNYNANFKRYKTYGFMKSSISDTTEFYNAIEKTIASRLGSQGFRFQDDKPDLLINYKIFFDEVKYRGYQQPDFDSWLKRQGTQVVEKDDDEDERKLTNKDENYNNIKYSENSGMLVIFVIDYKKGNTVWQGYTAAPFDYLSPNIQSDLTRATYRVMDQFRILTRIN